MNQIERIRYFEAQLDRLAAACAQLDEALDAYLAAQPAAKELSAYYGGPDWRRDFADDEAGRLPENLKRGVLSEDAAFDALTDNDRLARRLREIADRLDNADE